MTPVEVGALAAAVLAGSAAQAVSGLGFSLVAVPLVVALVGPADGIRLCVLLSMALNLVLLARDPAAVRWRPVAALLAAASVSAVVVGLVAAHLSGDVTTLAAGLAIVIGVGLIASGRRAPRLTGLGGALAAGTAAGAMNVLASVAGPPVVLWAGNRDWPARTTRASLQAFFAPLNVVTLLVLGLPDLGVAVLVSCALAMAIGTALGLRFAARVADQRARQITLAVAAAGGAALVVASVVGLVT